MNHQKNAGTTNGSVATMPGTSETRSVLASLRSLIPARRLRFSEALRIAEVQAARLRTYCGVGDEAVPEEALALLPRIVIERRIMPTSGVSFWHGGSWVIAVNQAEPLARQRFTIFHEYKHVIDHGQAERLYPGDRLRTSQQQAELVADYFAGCVLMPTRLLKRVWGEGTQDLFELADRFEVSPRAVEVRLSQTGLCEDRQRCVTSAERWRGTRARGDGAA